MQLNDEKKSITDIRNTTLLRIHTRYLSGDKLVVPVWDNKVPKERIGEKLYVGVISGNKHLLKRCGVYPERFLVKLGVTLIPKIPGVSKYDGEKTTHPISLKTHHEFKTITSVFNKRYGHGNWRFQCPKQLQRKLKLIEPKDTNMFSFGDFEADALKEKYPAGIPVTLIVHEPNANIPKQLFKVVLKG